jgi:hypothetical protein
MHGGLVQLKLSVVAPHDCAQHRPQLQSATSIHHETVRHGDHCHIPFMVTLLLSTIYGLLFLGGTDGNGNLWIVSRCLLESSAMVVILCHSCSQQGFSAFDAQPE